MQDVPLSKELQGALIAAGWESGRCIGVSQFESELHAEGYIISATARDFLAEFGGLTLRWQVSFPDGKQGDRLLEINPQRRDLARSDVQHIESRVGESLVPIGMYQDYETLLLGASGKVYTEADTILHLIAYDGCAALQAIFDGAAPVKRIPW